MSVKRVTALEAKQMRSLVGVKLAVIAELYGFHPDTVAYHRMPERQQRKRKEQWRKKQLEKNFKRRGPPHQMARKTRHPNQQLFARALMQYAVRLGIKRSSELAERLGINRTTMHYWLKKHAMPTQEHLDRLAIVTGMPMFAKMRGQWPTTEAYRELGLEPQAMAFMWYQPDKSELQ